jgi:GNAT superfamily N-acetyltransferase
MAEEDLTEVNSVFTKAFSRARIDEGLKQHRVSPCRIAFLKMYLDRSGEGALVAYDHEQVVGFNFNHLFGSTGWMGPLAVMPKYQGAGVGKAVVNAGVDYLRTRGATVIGLETMPRNFRNLGFYSRLGFDPGPLCLDMVAQAHGGSASFDSHAAEIRCFRDGTPAQKERLLRGCGEISAALSPGLDYSKEVLLNSKHRFGDTVFLIEGGEVAGFAVCHLEPYGQYEDRRELKVNVLAMRPGPPISAPAGREAARAGAAVPAGSAADRDGRAGAGPGSPEPAAGRRRARVAEAVPAEGPAPQDALARLPVLLAGVKDLAARERLSLVRLHIRSDKYEALRSLLSWGYRVGYSDLRMCLSGFEEEEPAPWVHFCRWQ